MPRSVNHVASRARRKKILNLQEVTSVAAAMCGPLLKTHGKKVLPTLTATVRLKNVISVLSGFSVSTPLLVLKTYRTQNSWVLSTKPASKSTVRCLPTLPSTILLLSKQSLKRLRTHNRLFYLLNTKPLVDTQQEVFLCLFPKLYIPKILTLSKFRHPKIGKYRTLDSQKLENIEL